MNFKVLFLIFLSINFLFKIFYDFLYLDSLKRKVPSSIEYLTKEEGYDRWQSYLKENIRFKFVKDIVTSIPMFLLVIFNVFSLIGNSISDNWIVQFVLLLLFNQGVTFIISLPFGIYDTFKIEEKYGFNKTKVPTFILDQIFSCIVDYLFTFVIGFIFFILYSSLNAYLSVIICSLIFISLTFLLQFLFPYFAKIRNKFVPLEEGELRTKLLDLMNSNSFKVEGIYVVNESKRSTKENAYFAGTGASRRIVIYDNLINNHTPDEIVAVFAHELGHAKCKHNLKSLPFNFIYMISIVLIIYSCTLMTNLSLDFGFNKESYFIIYLFAGELMELFEIVYSSIFNTISRKHEFEADRVAAINGYKDALIISLVNLTKKNYGLLVYNPVLEFLKASHPSLERRIANLEKYSK